MNKLKIALSVLALFVMGAAGVQTFGIWQVPPGVSEVLLAVATLLSYLGYQPFVLSAQVSRVFAVLSVAALGFVGSHGAAWGDGGKHIAIIVVGFAGALMGALARGLPGKPPMQPAPEGPDALPKP